MGVSPAPWRTTASTGKGGDRTASTQMGTVWLLRKLNVHNAIVDGNSDADNFASVLSRQIPSKASEISRGTTWISPWPRNAANQEWDESAAHYLCLRNDRSWSERAVSTISVCFIGCSICVFPSDPVNTLSLSALRGCCGSLFRVLESRYTQ